MINRLRAFGDNGLLLGFLPEFVDSTEAKVGLFQPPKLSRIAPGGWGARQEGRCQRVETHHLSTAWND